MESGEREAVLEWSEVRRHRTPEDAWTVVHGEVYDVSQFSKVHPGGGLILSAAGHDGSILFESHHALADRSRVDAALRPLRVGALREGVPAGGGYTFNSAFKRDLVDASKAALAAHGRREWEGVKVAAFVWTAHAALYAYLWSSGHTWSALPAAYVMGLVLGLMHLLGHGGSHGAVSRKSALTALNRAFAMLSMESYGMCLRHWTFSHVISHHGYSYTDHDCMLETHLPRRFWRISAKQGWRPVHAWQELLFAWRGAIAFVVSGCRHRVFPFVLGAPTLRSLLSNGLIPNPRFLAGGSTVELEALDGRHNGMGPDAFMAFDSAADELRAHLLCNAVWAPLFFAIASKSSCLWATVVLYVAFGCQARRVIQGLLLQHVSESSVLDTEPTGDWYKQQIEGSVDIFDSRWFTVITYGVALQAVHHVFPWLNGTECLAVRPALEAACRRHDVKYHYFPTTRDAERSGVARMRKLARPDNAQVCQVPS